MHRFLRRLAAAALLLLPSALALAPAASEAAPVTLRYDFNALITSTSYTHWCYADGNCADYESYGEATTYLGPPLSSYGASWLTVSFGEPYLDENGAPDGYRNIRFQYSILGLPSVGGMEWISDYDPADHSMSLWAYDGYDLFDMTIQPAEWSADAGSGYVWWEQDVSGVDWAQAEFRIYDLRVTDLSAPQPAPVPLPAALPLLAGGIAGLGWIGRRRARA